MIHLVTDSTAHFLDADFPRKHHITVLPLTVQFGQKSYQEGVDLAPAEFFKQLAEAKIKPSVWPPTVEAFAAVYADLSQQPEDEIISIHVSSKINATLQNAQTASTPYLGRGKLHLVDSRTTSTGLGWLVETAAYAAAAGASAAEIVRLVRGLAHQLYAAFFVNSLDALASAKRFSKAQAILGEMLGFKPFLSIEDGDLVPTGKMQDRQQAVERLIEFTTEFADAEIKHLAILQSSLVITDETKFLLEQLALSFPKREFPVLVYQPSLAAYLGADAMGVIVFEGPGDGR